MKPERIPLTDNQDQSAVECRGSDMKAENCAQKIIQHTEKATAALEDILKEHTDKIEDVGTGIITRRLRDASIVVCDQSGHQAPHWYERHTTEWVGEGDEGKRRLAATKGTIWVVDLSPSQFHVFETEPEAEHCCQKQLHLNPRGSIFWTVRYVDGQRQTHRS